MHPFPLRRRPFWPTAALAVLAWAAPAAHAAPGTFPDPGGSGASITISDTEVVPGERLEISGKGFSVSGGGGYPLIAIKPYDSDPLWDFGGPDAYPGPSDAHIWFVAQATDHGFSGHIDIPKTLTPDGLGGATLKGIHWLRILSGAFSTADGVTVPITYKVPFNVVDRVTLGMTNFSTPSTFQKGSTARPGTLMTVQGHGFTPSASVSVSLDGAPLATSITTDVEGDFPSTARLTVPTAASIGAHTLSFVTGSGGAAVTADAALTVVPPPTASLATTSVRPGGRLAVRVSNFIGLGATGQKVAVVVDEVVLACLQTDASGNASGVGTLPADTPIGSATVGFASGTSCLGPTGAQDDLPLTRITQSLSVSATAPSLTAADTVAAGSALTLAGEGFGPSQAVAASLDGAPLAASLTSSADGRIAGSVAIPASTPTGSHALLLNTGGASAVATFTTTAARPPKEEDPPVVEQPLDAPVVVAITAPVQTPAVVVPPVPAPIVALPGAPLAKKITAKGKTLKVTLSGKAAPSASVVVTTDGKVGLGRKSKVVMLAKGTTSRTGVVSLTLTADGRKLLKSSKKIKVVVEISASGRTATKARLSLRGT
jgi:hypothetical protein